MKKLQTEFEIFKNQKSITLILPKNKKKVFLFCYSLEEGNMEVSVDVALKTGSSAYLMFICFLKGQSCLTLKTTQEHTQKNSFSEIYARTVLLDQSKFDFTGNIYISNSAENAKSYLKNNNLLFGNNVVIKSSPNLEILAKKVDCSHSASSVYLDQNSINYLMKRGISENKAKRLLVRAFFLEVLQQAVSAGVDQNKAKQIERSIEAEINI
jgi:Fe-S cluster assembly protein SufD